MALIKLNTRSLSDDSVTTPKIADTVNLGRRNIIINGAMNIAQRGTSSTSTGYSGLDRYLLSNSNTNTTITHSQQYDGPDGFQYCYELKNTSDGTPAAASYLELQQRVEAINARAVNQADSFTVSFYYKSNVTGTLPVQIYNRTDANSYWRNWQGLSVTGDGTWRRAEFTFTKNSAVAALPKVDNDWGFIVAFNLELGTDYVNTSNENTWINSGSVAGQNFGLCGSLNDYIRITGLQVEIGDTATPFEHRSFGEDLSLCQRYFCTTYPHGTVPGTGGSTGIAVGRSTDGTSSYTTIAQWSYPVVMRATPTIALYNPVTGTSNSFRGDGTNYSPSQTIFTSTKAVTVNAGAVSIGTSNYVSTHITATAEL